MKAADEPAKVLGLSGSKLHPAALERSLQDHDDEAITAKLNEIYATESSGLAPVLQIIQARSIPKGSGSSRL